MQLVVLQVRKKEVQMEISRPNTRINDVLARSDILGQYGNDERGLRMALANFFCGVVNRKGGIARDIGRDLPGCCRSRYSNHEKEDDSNTP